MVIRQVDLNHETLSLRVPSQMEIIKRFWCCCCQSAPLIVTAQTPMSGYAPGQMINISGELNNKSGVTVNSLHFTLMKTVAFFAESPSSKVRKQFLVVAEADTDVTIVAEGYKKFSQALAIPPVAPTNLTQSKVIHQTYELIVEARISGCHRNLVTSIPITIGTVPLRQQSESPMATGPGLDDQPFTFQTSAAPSLDQNGQENSNFLELRKLY
jgi:Arrestin (or S-antigen), C-terminal domain